MSLENGRLITDGKTIEPCCEDAEYYCEEDDIGISIWHISGQAPNYKLKWFVTMQDYVERTYISFCPYCGAKLEYVGNLDSE